MLHLRDKINTIIPKNSNEEGCHHFDVSLARYILSEALSVACKCLIQLVAVVIPVWGLARGIGFDVKKNSKSND